MKGKSTAIMNIVSYNNHCLIIFIIIIFSKRLNAKNKNLKRGEYASEKQNEKYIRIFCLLNKKCILI
jgi:hypothetical protein